MAARVMKVRNSSAEREAIVAASEVLDRGGLVVIPTETVYGVAARADRPEGIRRLRELKIRDDGKPFTLHLGSRAHVETYVGPLTGYARRITTKGWPGPLTLVFTVPPAVRETVAADRGPRTSDEIYFEGTVGIRYPDHELACAVLREAGGPVVASSANRAGDPAPTTAAESIERLAGDVDLVLDAGTTRYTRSSTVARVNENGFEILREGVYDARTLERLAVLRLLFICSGNTCRSPMAEGLCKRLLAERIGCSVEDLPARRILVESAGTSGGGGGASEGARRAMAARGIDLSGHGSRLLTADLARQADYLFVMTPSHYLAVLDLAPELESRVRLLDERRAIEDPFGGDDAAYEACAAQIEQALIRRLQEVQP
ncbi:MAG: threonylcarbamoyl-AMP synthase [Phycisphaerae bacterium]|nr:MAG: threonylcarbamoyl-AMP synthase [Planctomycetota bacterium]KAB2942166.1 MAG: threonylcarbamoyl-AMP synthase [Phycisphaerae bacterium]MBE7458047.1 threonylcarbamoyl-AMP synthase [Planctomycetia bacterium]MCK6464489.1 threonylcarbamoyl-AMP synthase [Phycisphaerae bacterium]MCL4717961.1 threonylcarbamoyl-AMP synthase [Phycisphaerae bacterium]